jgi:hypothetical protein
MCKRLFFIFHLVSLKTIVFFPMCHFRFPKWKRNVQFQIEIWIKFIINQREGDDVWGFAKHISYIFCLHFRLVYDQVYCLFVIFYPSPFCSRNFIAYSHATYRHVLRIYPTIVYIYTWTWLANQFLSLQS